MRLRGVLAVAVLSVLSGFAVATATPAVADTGTGVTPRLVTGSGLGFDTALAVRPSTLRAWSVSPYRTVNAYFSGTQRKYPNQTELTADWVKTVLTNGWSIIPTVVDLQAPCYSGTSKATMSSNASTAATQGRDTASQAHTDLVNLGLGGTVAYLDLENFKTTVGSTCDKAVRSFVTSYVHRLHKLGDRAGVYFNAHQGATTIVPLYGHADAPDDVWVADWDDVATSADSVIGTKWPHHRIHQYHSDPTNTTENYAGIGVNVDRDALDGDVVAGAGVSTPTGSYLYNVNGNQASGDTLNVRTEPDTGSSSTVVATLNGGDQIDIQCQATGETVNGDYVWDKLADGTYVSDLFTTTTGRNWVSSSIPKCDATAPSVTVTAPPSVTLAASLSVHWTAADNPDPAPGTPPGETRGISSSQFRYRLANYGGSFGGWHYVNTTALRADFPAGSGHSYCMQVRSFDLSGNSSFWSAQACFAKPLDDRAMSRGSGWTLASNRHFYLGTVTSAKSKGRVLARTHASLDRVGVVATTCSSCGAVRVYVGSHLVGAISLHASSTHYRQVFTLPAFSQRSGTVRLVTTSNRLVQIDGVLITRI